MVEEQGHALIRAAFSPIVPEFGDIPAGVSDCERRMLVQADTGMPGPINTMAEAVKTRRGSFAEKDMKPGDVYMTDDPLDCFGTSQRLFADDAGVFRLPRRRLYVLHLASG